MTLPAVPRDDVTSAIQLALVVGLAFFLREVHLATKTVRIPIPDRR